MKSKTVLITGSSGIIGSLLVQMLQEVYVIIKADLPLHDLRDWDTCISLIEDAGIDAIVHLAWNTKTENWGSERIDPDNWRMTENIFLAARKCRVPRVIIASSVHVHNYKGLGAFNELPINPYHDCIPSSPYGAHKLGLEKLGQWNSTMGLEVVCVRFGGICNQEAPGDDFSIVGLSHPDCAKMITCCIDVPKVPNKFTVFYAVSANKGRIHDYNNTFGWIPSDDAEFFYNIRPSAKLLNGFRRRLGVAIRRIRRLWATGV